MFSTRKRWSPAMRLPGIASRMAVVEGKQSVLAALSARQRQVEVVLLRHGAHAEKVADVLAAAHERGTPVRWVDGRELDNLAHAASHGGVIAIASPKPRLSVDGLLTLVEDLLARRQPPLLLLLEGLDDARNLGFVLRTAEATGVHAVMIKKHLWDFDETEVARPSSGAYERLPLVQLDDVEPLKQLQKRGLRFYGCIANAKRTMYDRNLASGCILALGGEKRGLSGAVRSICDRLLTIPVVGGASSLSLSHAAAIVLAEAMRQRMATAAPHHGDLLPLPPGEGGGEGERR